MNLNIFKNKYLKLGEYLVSFSILIYVIYYVGSEQTYSALQSFDILYLFMAFLIFSMAFLISFFPVYFLYRPLIHIPISDFLRYKTYSVAFGLFTPMKLGELSLSLMLKKKYKIGIFKSTVIILFDKFITVVATSFNLFAAYLILVYFLKYSFLSYFQNYVILMLLALVLCFFVLVYSLSLHRILLKIKFFRKYIKRFFGSFLLLHKTYKTHLGAPLMDLLVTFLSMIIIVVPSYILFISLGFKISFIYLLFIASAATFFSLVPFTLSGLGVREAFVVYLYSLVDIPPPVSLAMMLIFLFFRYLTPFLFILLFGFFKRH